MNQATTPLTMTAWRTVLKRYAAQSGDQTLSTMAKMLLDVLNNSTDPAIGPIFDIHFRKLIGE